MTVDRFGNPHAPNLPCGAEDRIRAEGRIHQGTRAPSGAPVPHHGYTESAQAT